MGSGCLNQGNNGYDTKCSYDGDNQERGGKNLRKPPMCLSNSKTIYHFSGNVWEWVRDNNSRSQGSDKYVSSHYENRSLSNNLDYSSEGIYPSCNNERDRYCGLGYGWLNYPGETVIRGGSWYPVSKAGVFGATLYSNSLDWGYGVGFRCVLQPKSDLRRGHE